MEAEMEGRAARLAAHTAAGVLALSEVWVLVVSDRGTWGKGPDLAEALKNARKPKSYLCFLVHPEACVNDFGMVLSPPGPEGHEEAFAPVELFRKGPGVKPSAKKVTP